MQLLTSLEEVRQYRTIDPNFDRNRFNSFLLEVQQVRLRQLLGDALYRDFMNSYPDNDKYEKLLSGESYIYSSNTVDFFGLKPLIAYWWLALATKEGDLFLSDYGAIEFVNNTQQNFEKAKTRDSIVMSYNVTAEAYENDVRQYLNTKQSTYPLWKGSSVENASGVNLIMFRV